MPIPIPYVLIGFGLLLVLMAIPLILRRVPMNPGYGIRIRKAFASERNWYEINAYGGKLFAIYGLLLVAFASLTGLVAPDVTSIWSPVYLVVPLLGLIPVIVLVNRFSRRLPE